jgi:arylsulfatase
MSRSLCLALLLLVTVPLHAAESPPNVVLIIADDVSAEDIGCFGNPAVRTPNIDRLAGRGLAFDTAYLTISTCSATRCSILTSRYPHNLETASELHGALPDGVALFPKVLREAGYYTVQSGKGHLGEDPEHVVGPAATAFDVTGDGDRNPLGGGHGGEGRWVDRLRQRPPDRPFFMWFASHDAHRPWDADAFAGFTKPQDVRVPLALLDTPETRADLAHYYDEITRLDYYVGEVVAELEREHVLDRTVVIFLSDNGRPFPHSKTRLYDDGIKTPLIISWPGVTAPGRTKSLVSVIDLAPTILAIAGLPRPETFQGVSLLPVLRDPTAAVRAVVFAEHNWHNFQAHVRMVREGNFVYMVNAWPALPLPGASETFYNPSADALKAARASGRLTPLQADVFRQPRPAEELYDLSIDPREENNLAVADARSPVLDKMRALMTRWIRETGDTVPTNPTRTNVVYATGEKIPGFHQGEPPGAATHAARINAPGPIWDRPN